VDIVSRMGNGHTYGRDDCENRRYDQCDFSRCDLPPVENG